MPDIAPFDDIRALIAALPQADEKAAAACKAAERDALYDGTGLIPETAQWLARWSGRAAPQVSRPTIAVFAASHGVAKHGVSAWNDADTTAFLDGAGSGSALLPKLCGDANIGLKVLDLAVDLPVRDITMGPALEERDCAATMAFGMEAVAGGHDLLCVSSVAAGGSTAARALLAALHGGDGKDWAGQGPQHQRLREIEAIDAALRANRTDRIDGLEVLRAFGGREISAMAGAILAARMERVPVILDGLPAIAAAATLHRLSAGSVAHCRLARELADLATTRAAELLGLPSILMFEKDLSPGTASVFATGVARAAAMAAKAA